MLPVVTCPDLYTLISCWFTGVGEGNIKHCQIESDNVTRDPLENPDKPSKANSEIKKTWGFRRSTVLKREMPVEAATDSPESRCPVRRSGRQSKRTDKLEEFLLTTKRGPRKSAPPSLEGGDRPSQTDAETASEASFDGNADTKAAEEKLDGPERRTRSSTRKQTQQKTQASRQTRGSGVMTVKDEGSSENEEDSRDGDKTDNLHGKSEKKDESEPVPKDIESTTKSHPQPDLDSENKELDEEKDELSETNDKMKIEDTDADKPTAMLVKRGPIRTYINKKKAANRNATPVKSPVKKETNPKSTQGAEKTRTSQNQDDDDDEEVEEDEEDDDDDDDDGSSSSSSSSIESDDGGYDPNALYCICRQKHNKRYLPFLFIIRFVRVLCICDIFIYRMVNSFLNVTSNWPV